MNQQQTQFIDAESYTGSGSPDKITFREIVLNQVKRISGNANVEFRGGFWEHRPHPNPASNETIKIYVADSREVYSNSVEYLFDLIFPHADKELKEAEEKAEKELSQVYEECLFFNEKRVEQLKELSEEEKQKKIKALHKWRVFDSQNQKVEYRDLRVRIMRKLFREICCFLKRVDYFEGKTFEDEI